MKIPLFEDGYENTFFCEKIVYMKILAGSGFYPKALLQLRNTASTK